MFSFQGAEKGKEIRTFSSVGRATGLLISGSPVRVREGAPSCIRAGSVKRDAGKCGWPVGQVVKTEASHAFNIGSNPVRVTTSSKLHIARDG